MDNKIIGRFFDGEELFEIARLIKVEIDNLDNQKSYKQTTGVNKAIEDRIQRLKNLREDILYLSACLRQEGINKGIRLKQMFEDERGFDLSSIEDLGYKGEGAW
jgi:hypothetical protein